MFLWPVTLGISGRNVAKGDSPLRGRLGEQVLDPCLTLRDDPHRDSSQGAREVDADGIPTRAKLEELRGTRFTPEEGFILSRINGRSDIRSIIKISPLSELGSLLVFWKLVRAGHIRFEGAR